MCQVLHLRFVDYNIHSKTKKVQKMRRCNKFLRKGTKMCL